MPDPNRSYPGGNGHPAELPVGTIIRGSIAKTKTYKGQQRDPDTGEFKKAPGTLRLPHMTGWESHTLAVCKSRYDFKVAMDEWKALSEDDKQTYRDRAKQIRKDHPNPLNPKRWWLGHHLYISENLRRNTLTPPDYDSGWIAINAGQTKTITHDLGGDEDDYLVIVWGNGGVDGTSQQFYGGIETAAGDKKGYFWKELDNSIVKVRRRADDGTIDNVRVRIWKYC